MFKNLLLVALTSMSYVSVLTLQSSDNVNTTNVNTTSYSQNDFIAPDSPTFRLGDYDVKQVEHISAGGGEVRFNRIDVSVPYSVFENLAQYWQVYISIPNYYYNSTVALKMDICLYTDQGFLDYAIDPPILLSETMLAHLGFTVVDNPPYTYPPNQVNYFDPACWDYDTSSYNEIRLTFTVPYVAYSDPPTDWQQALLDITLFTELSVYSSDGYADGYSDGYADGVQEGLSSSDGTWLGHLVFGTVGGVVGFIFALADFEVLGVSIMSIIALFVAIGIIMLFIKLIKGTN